MAIKTYNVTQHVNLNGVKKSTSFRFTGEQTELEGLLALLEGGYTVTEQNDTLSNTAGSENLVTSYKRSTRIGMSAKTSEGHPVYATIKPFQGSIYFKQTADSSDIEAVFANAHPFPLAPTVKPQVVTVNLSEDLAVASGSVSGI